MTDSPLSQKIKIDIIQALILPRHPSFENLSVIIQLSLTSTSTLHHPPPPPAAIDGCPLKACTSECSCSSSSIQGQGHPFNRIITLGQAGNNNLSTAAVAAATVRSIRSDRVPLSSDQFATVIITLPLSTLRVRTFTFL